MSPMHKNRVAGGSHMGPNLSISHILFYRPEEQFWRDNSPKSGVQINIWYIYPGLMTS